MITAPADNVTRAGAADCSPFLACTLPQLSKGINCDMMITCAFRLAYVTVTNAFAALRLLPLGDRDKDIEILALRHQITVLERQLGADTKVRFAPAYRVFLAALLAPLPHGVLRRLRLLVWSDTVLRRHRDLLKQGHAHI
ncbi:hypothetical protein ACFOY2_54220 [Nonomuraea purpurea]|uniref:Uncharacterized protein n=1 Tax=Nonomuraea purpurea TaxID=1849276 RepID=A0ABV8GU58_9ACTN